MLLCKMCTAANWQHVGWLADTAIGGGNARFFEPIRDG
jgi:hypothetical protein